MWIHYPDGSAREGVMVSLRGAVMRVAVQGCDDTLEFSSVNGSWMSESGDAVSFVFSLGLTDHEAFRAAVQPALCEPPGNVFTDAWSSCKSVN